MTLRRDDEPRDPGTEGDRDSYQRFVKTTPKPRATKKSSDRGPLESLVESPAAEEVALGAAEVAEAIAVIVDEGESKLEAMLGGGTGFAEGSRPDHSSVMRV